MSKIVLAIDCSQRMSLLALSVDGVVHERRFEANSAEPRERFWDELRALHADAGITAAQLTAIAVATGPGGFTGLRVSISFAQTVAFALGIPIVALPSPIVFAASHAKRAASTADCWLVALASKHGGASVTRVEHCAKNCARGRFIEVSSQWSDAELFAQWCAQLGHRGALLADEHLDPLLLAQSQLLSLICQPIVTDATALIDLARAALAAGEAVDPATVLPRYAREPEAVTNWRARHPSR